MVKLERFFYSMLHWTRTMGQMSLKIVRQLWVGYPVSVLLSRNIVLEKIQIEIMLNDFQTKKTFFE